MKTYIPYVSLRIETDVAQLLRGKGSVAPPPYNRKYFAHRLTYIPYVILAYLCLKIKLKRIYSI